MRSLGIIHMTEIELPGYTPVIPNILFENKNGISTEKTGNLVHLLRIERFVQPLPHKIIDEIIRKAKMDSGFFDDIFGPNLTKEIISEGKEALNLLAENVGRDISEGSFNLLLTNFYLLKEMHAEMKGLLSAGNNYEVLKFYKEGNFSVQLPSWGAIVSLRENWGSPDSARIGYLLDCSVKNSAYLRAIGEPPSYKNFADQVNLVDRLICQQGKVSSLQDTSTLALERMVGETVIKTIENLRAEASLSIVEGALTKLSQTRKPNHRSEEGWHIN